MSMAYKRLCSFIPGATSQGESEEEMTPLDAWPIGSVYLSSNPTSPATLFGGTWDRIAEGRTFIGLDATDPDFDTVGAEGGAKTHTLTEAEMPAHTHIQDAHGHGVTDPNHNHIQDAHGHGVTDPGHLHSVNEGQTDGDSTFFDKSSAADASPALATLSATTGLTVNNTTPTNQAAATGVTVNNATAVNQAAGSGDPHNNIPPYKIVWSWERIA